MTLVVGATGFLGAEVCRRLVAEGESVRGAVRATSDDATVRRLQALGVETVQADVRDPASLDAACAGVSAVMSTVTCTRSRQPGDSVEATDLDGQLALVNAAACAGVSRFVYVSYSGHLTQDSPLTRAKRSVEQRIRDSGMAFTILRPTYFMEVWLSPALGFDAMNGTATIYGDGTRPISFISRGDVAAFAVAALRNPAAAGELLELGGPDALAPLQVVRTFEDAGGKPIAVQHVPVDALAQKYDAASDSLAKSFAGLMLDYARGDAIPMDDVRRRIPFSMTSVRDFAKATLGK
jgi:NADH dehydrogenase